MCKVFTFWTEEAATIVMYLQFLLFFLAFHFLSNFIIIPFYHSTGILSFRLTLLYYISAAIADPVKVNFYIFPLMFYNFALYFCFLVTCCVLILTLIFVVFCIYNKSKTSFYPHGLFPIKFLKRFIILYCVQIVILLVFSLFFLYFCSFL